MWRLILSLSVFLATTIFFSLCSGNTEADKKNFITLKEDLLSIDAYFISPENILKQLGDVCGIKILFNENSFPDILVSIKFQDLPLDEGVKKILKATRFQNYIIQYQKVSNRNYISGIEFLGSKSVSRVLTPGQEMEIQQTKLLPKIPRENPTTTSLGVLSEEMIDDKINALEEGFKWDDTSTLELAKEFLRDTPPQARKYALEGMTKSISNYLKKEGNGVVDKEMVYRAAVETVPNHMPEMKEKVKNYLDSLD